MTAEPADGLQSFRGEALERFVYVVGMARGGTSVIRDAVGIHDRILMLPGMTHFVNQVWRYRNKVHDRLLRQIFQLPEFYREASLRTGLEQGKSPGLRARIEEALGSGDLKRMWQIYPTVYAQGSRSRVNPEEIACWGDKANDFYGMEKIHRSFPLGKFIFVLRDPRGVAASMAKRTAVIRKGSYDAAVEERELIHASISWRNMTQRMLRFAARHREKVLLVKFEDFLRAPAETLNEIFDFVTGVPLTRDVIERRLESLGYGASNIPGERGTGISKAPLERWKKSLSQDQVKRIEEITGETARKVGYLFGSHHSGATLFRIALRGRSLKEKTVLMTKLCYLQALEKATCPLSFIRPGTGAGRSLPGKGR